MDMNIRYDGKTVLITGGTAGIGLATAQVFGSLGAKVAICGTNPTKLGKAVEALKSAGIDVYGQVCNVADAASMDDFASNTEKALGPVDVWILNAGIYPQFSIIDTDETVFDQVLDVNIKAVYLGARIAYKAMKDRGGVILMASSFASLFPSVGSGAYAASKSAVGSMIKTLAAELAPYRIRVNGYIPGVILTDMTAPVRAVNAEGMKSAIAMREFGKPEDVSWALAFLASDYASYITGTTLEISGGKMGVQNPAKAWADKDARG